MKRFKGDRFVCLLLLVAAALLLALGLSLARVPEGEAAVGSMSETPSLVCASGQLVGPSALRPQEESLPMDAASVSQSAVADDTRYLLVRFSSEVSPDDRVDMLENVGLREIRTIDQLGVSVAEMREPVPSSDRQAFYPEALRVLRTIPAVQWVEPSHEAEHQLTPNDPVYRYQWGPGAVGLTSAWNVTTGSSSVRIAIIDTGLGYIADFTGRVVYPYSIPFDTSAQWAWTDIDGHGTACAGIAAAMGNNSQGMAGAAWNVELMPVHVADYENPTDWEIAAGFAYATDLGADVISISWGSYYYSRTVAAAVNYAVSRGVVVVAAAGNGGAGSGIAYPASLPGVIAVGASSPGDGRCAFSSSGNEIDMLAPGQDIYTYVYVGNGYWDFNYLSGTSFSVPLVAGVAGLMLSRDGALTSEKIAGILAATANDLGTSGWDSYNGDGLLDAQEAVTSAGDRTPPSLAFTQPSNGSVVNGEAEFLLSVSDNVGVYKVEQFLDGEIAFTTMARIPHYYDQNEGGALNVQDFGQPVVGILNSTNYPDGSSHTIMAKAYDAAGNTRTASVSFTIDNRPATTTTTLPTTTTTLPPTTTTTLPSGQQFTDVPPSHPYFVQITDLASRGIVTGYGFNLFRPNESVVRQQFAKMIVKTLGLVVTGNESCPFSDVDQTPNENDPFYPAKYVAVCYLNSITSGKTATSFAPYDGISRQQLITMVTRAASLPAPSDDYYTPPFLSSQFYPEEHYFNARKAAYAGLLDGLQGLGPSYGFMSPATRGEVCVLLHNLLNR